MNKKKTYLDHGTTLFLRGAVLGMGLIVLILGIMIVPMVFQDWAKEFPNQVNWRLPVMVVLVGTALAFFAAVAQIYKLLTLIDKNKAFSGASVSAMQNVKYCGLVISGLYAACLPLVYFVANEEDAPGLTLLFGIIFVGAPLVLGVFAGVAQRLFQNAIDIKSENDLTV